MGKSVSSIDPQTLYKQALADPQCAAYSPEELRLLQRGFTALSTPQKRLDAQEHKAVKSVIAYVAYLQEVSEERISKLLAKAFGVPSVTALPAQCYNAAIRYLVDLKLAQNLN